MSKTGSCDMDCLVLGKFIVTFIILLFLFDLFRPGRKRGKTPADPSVAAADAREQYNWRYIRLVYLIFKVVVIVLFFATMIQYVIS